MFQLNFSTDEEMLLDQLSGNSVTELSLEKIISHERHSMDLSYNITNPDQSSLQNSVKLQKLGLLIPEELLGIKNSKYKPKVENLPTLTSTRSSIDYEENINLITKNKTIAVDEETYMEDSLDGSPLIKNSNKKISFLSVQQVRAYDIESSVNDL